MRVHCDVCNSWVMNQRSKIKKKIYVYWHKCSTVYSGINGMVRNKKQPPACSWLTVAPSKSSKSKLSTRPTPLSIRITCTSDYHHWNALKIISSSVFLVLHFVTLGEGVTWSLVSLVNRSLRVVSLEVSWNLSRGRNISIPSSFHSPTKINSRDAKTLKRHRPGGENPPRGSFSRWGRDAENRITLHFTTEGKTWRKPRSERRQIWSSWTVPRLSASEKSSFVTWLQKPPHHLFAPRNLSEAANCQEFW